VTEFDSIDYPGIHHTTLEQRWSAALTVVEGTLRKFDIEGLPQDPDECDQVTDDLMDLLESLGLVFISQLPDEELGETHGGVA